MTTAGEGGPGEYWESQGETVHSLKYSGYVSR